ncbi:class C beta-lactamase-related serine hydrolase [Euzebyella marina]|uniref:Class C beta-lactamase-related serine hydrolase n=1 Tax=Euzebyella marina TaxID=1761453 RepID=A0A3G2L7B3_9FLAO|nr:serine hydrolase [Euzebyella marina]AYN68073.1 class C beta-lactamase-related serine hydrolase [Euzebyella marina]
MKIAKRVLLAVLIILAIVIYTQYPKLNIISGYAAKNMASTVFLAHRSAESVNANDNNVPLIKLAEVSSNETSAEASVFGLMQRTSVCFEGIGCILVNDDFDEKASYRIPSRSKSTAQLPFPYGNKEPKDTIFPEVDYQLLNKALDSAFSRPEVQKTRTVLVNYKNQMVAERYVDGFNAETPVLGWSMTKSVLATLYGILEYQDKIDLNLPAPIEDWKTDERKEITINHLLRMQSGLEWEEDYSSISDVTRMLFLDTDMTLGQAQKPAIAKPTEIWNYSSGTSNLLSGILRDHFETQQAYLDFPYSALIDKIGMNSMIIETDQAGNYVGSSYAWANTRDWAKFGILYLNEGEWNGQHLFDRQWVDYITTPTAHSDGTYGGHFWLNAEGKYPDVPKDMYSANGYQGQRVFIIPSKDLVIVRTGLAEEPDFNINTFLKDVLAAFPSTDNSGLK